MIASIRELENDYRPKAGDGKDAGSLLSLLSTADDPWGIAPIRPEVPAGSCICRAPRVMSPSVSRSAGELM